MRDSNFKHLGEAMARRMHPDLDWPKPSLEVEDKLKRYQVMDELELLWEMSVHPDLEIDIGFSPKSMVCTVLDHKTWKIDVELTQKKLAKAMKALQSFGATIEKEYSDNYFKIISTFKCGLKYTLIADREVACTKRVVGTEYVPPAYGYTKEIIEWDCEHIAFSALEVD